VNTPCPDAYYDTVFLLEGAPSPLPEVFTIVTAWNPMDRACSAEQNQVSDTRLQQALQTIDSKTFRAIGCSPDFAHREPGWAIQCPFEQALELARRFDQRAFWWIENNRLNLVSCLDPEPEFVAAFSHRVVSHPNRHR